ncbi:hypothetical protein FEM48_Zijuj10G0169700 [Ziziphus jujuba var. spinosa]|uniref:Morc S5 domain-containing protein n=1 Tax=Ziziphus jujuba var. spinosa TaxID=714518 RepID=A0A978UPL5_ZIZJJ|nr:hypothetical protein FEM48_Zijuj10G0169700 [Ziziphus jujuba var. spinosa]
MNSSVFVKKETPAAADTDFCTKRNNDKVKTTPIDISSSSGSDNNNSSYSSAQSSNVNDPSNDDHDAAISDSLAKLKNLRERLNSYKRNLDVREEISSSSQTKKKPKLEHCETESPLGFLQPLPPFNFPYIDPVVLDVAPISQRFPENHNGIYNNNLQNSNSDEVGIDHVRVHPRFLHSNATSHKWALGAFAELLDNSLDEVCNGATFVNVDMINNVKDGSHMLLVDDNGGGMNPDKMRQCMSLGYSVKSKMANTIGQYGNGFKTSTMRLGADVIVFSRCHEKDGTSSTQSVGMLSYTFLRGTGKEDIVVPMIDYEKSEHGWRETIRSSLDDWNKNLATILQWSPYSNEQHLFQQDDEGLLELDFDADPHDIQIRGVNRDEKNIRMAQEYPNCRHFLTYRHSLRSYASILYLRLPPDFRIVLRGKDVEHHNIVFATGTLGFVKDAKAHIDVQGFNVYHKNRLIKPFWRVWNPAGSDGRGVIGVLEANFVEPAHDKQGFERTTVLSRLEARLVWMQKDYWSRNCQEVGYAARRPIVNSADKAGSVSNKKKSTRIDRNSHSATGGSPKICSKKDDKKSSPVNATSEGRNCHKLSQSRIEPQQHHKLSHSRVEPQQHVKVAHCNEAGPDSANHRAENKIKLEEEKSDSRERIMETQGPVMDSLLNDLKQERERCKSLETKVQELEQKVEEADKEQMALIDMLAEEMAQRDEEEERLRQKLRDASNTIDKLLDKVKRLEGR